MSQSTQAPTRVEPSSTAQPNPSVDVLKEMILVLKKPAKARTESDLELLKKSTQSNQFFQGIREEKGEEFHTELFRHLGYQYAKAGEVLLEAGSVSSNFYVILDGVCEVHIKSVVMTEKGIKVGMKKIKELQAGAQLGELALLEDVLKPRSATIICKENCHFATLEWNGFKNLLGGAEHRKMTAQTDFLGSTAVFKGTSNHGLKAWVYLFESKEIYPKNFVLYNEGDDPEYIYIVKSGQVLCKMSFPIKRKTSESEEAVMDGNNSLYVVERPSLSKPNDMFLLGPGEMFGEEECFAEYQRTRKIYSRRDTYKAGKKWHSQLEGKFNELSSKRVTSMTVFSVNAEIWKVSKKNFFPKLEGNPRISRTMIETIFMKKGQRENRVTEIQNGLSQYLNFVGTRTGQAFKQDIFSAIKLKKFRQNGEPSLRKFLENRISIDKETIERHSENKASIKNTDTQNDQHSIANLTTARGQQDMNTASINLDFNFVTKENKISTRKDSSRTRIEDKLTIQTEVSLGNVSRFKLSLQTNKSQNTEDKPKKSVRPASSCATSSHRKRTQRPASACKTSFKSTGRSSRDNSIINPTLNDEALYSTLIPAELKTLSPSTTTKPSLNASGYLNSRPPTSRVSEIISPNMFQHMKRRSFFVGESSETNRPEGITKYCSSVKNSVDNSCLPSPMISPMNTALNFQQMMNRKLDSQANQFMVSLYSASNKNAVTDEKNITTTSFRRTQRPVSAIRPRSRAEGETDKSYSREKPVNRTITTELQGEEKIKSKLFYQALHETYGKRLIKLNNILNNQKELKRKQVIKEQHPHC